MITSVALNPSVDMTLEVASFTEGGLNRVIASRRDAGGKGLNVALALKAFGEDVCCAGFMYRENASLFEEILERNGVRAEMLYGDGAVRMNMKVRDTSKGLVTELNQSGRKVSPLDRYRMCELITSLAAESTHMVFTGSLPPGCESGYYRELMETAAGSKCRCILDADGERLREGLTAKPWLVKPNRFELEQLTGKPLKELPAVRDEAVRLARTGIAYVAVSLGQEGAMLTDGNECVRAETLRIPVGSTVGAGDTMIAALTHMLSRGRSITDALRFASACAAAACMKEGTEVFDLTASKELLDRVEILKMT